MCGRKLFSKSKRLYERLRVWSCNCLGNRCRYYLWRMQEACRRALINWMVYFYRVIAISSYPWSFEVLTFLWAFFRAQTVLLLQCTSILVKKFTNVYGLFHKFFLTWITTGEAGYQNEKRSISSQEKRENVSTRDTVALDKRACWKWMNNCGF